jgi:hypothetical protein
MLLLLLLPHLPPNASANVTPEARINPRKSGLAPAAAAAT